MGCSTGRSESHGGSPDEELSDRLLIEFGHDPPALAEGFQRGGRIQSMSEETLSRRLRVSGDVGDGSVEHLLGLVRPNYPSVPRSHFRRIARSTSSCGIVRPAATSA